MPLNEMSAYVERVSCAVCDMLAAYWCSCSQNHFYFSSSDLQSLSPTPTSGGAWAICTALRFTNSQMHPSTTNSSGHMVLMPYTTSQSIGAKYLPACEQAFNYQFRHREKHYCSASKAQNHSASRLSGEAMIRTLFFLLPLATLVDGAFTRPAHWKLDAIEQTHAGSWCYRPGASPSSHSQCSNSTLSMFVNAHVKNEHGAGLSIAYYDFADGSPLGGSGWTDWDTVTLPAGVCMSGRVDGVDDAYTTTCRFTIADNDHEMPASHVGECMVNRAQLRVADGCYTPPPRHGFRLNDSVSGIMTIVGLILALPLFGAYRWYRARCARRLARTDDEQVVPLLGLESGGPEGGGVDGGDSLDLAHPDPSRAEG